MRRFATLFASLLILGTSVPAPGRADDPSSFPWKDGDRVVLIGDALIERDQKYGYLETLITLQNPDKTITFRNLGWSGDTVRGLARARFGKPEEGYRHLVDHVLALKPTVLIVGYGMTDSFDGEAGLPRFKEGLNGLLDDLAGTKARLIVLSPIAHEDLGPPLPDPRAHNRDLRLYRDVLRAIAGERGARFIDLFEPLESLSPQYRREPEPRHPFMTDDGIHLNRLGYWSLTRSVSLGLGGDQGRGVLLGAHGPALTKHASVAKVKILPGGMRFEITDQFLPPPRFIPEDPSEVARVGPGAPVLGFVNLDDGRYSLFIDGRKVAEADADAWEMTLAKCSPGPEDDQVEQLRRAIIEKNRLYFYRWRPQNETYLFGFRKHEQGNNAREVPLFDPLVDEKEKEIARLKIPVAHVYELIREREEAK